MNDFVDRLASDIAAARKGDTFQDEVDALAERMMVAAMSTLQLPDAHRLPDPSDVFRAAENFIKAREARRR